MLYKQNTGYCQIVSSNFWEGKKLQSFIYRFVDREGRDLVFKGPLVKDKKMDYLHKRKTFTQVAF